MECGIEAKKLGLELGYKGQTFQENSKYKGCYYFGPKHPSEKKNTAFFGTRGSIKQMVEYAMPFDYSWYLEWQYGKGYKSLTKQCLVAGNVDQLVSVQLELMN